MDDSALGLGGGFNPDFDDDKPDDKDDVGNKSEKIHLRVQQRNGRKSITTVQGLSTDLDLKKIVKAVKKVCPHTVPLRPLHFTDAHKCRH